MTNTVPLSRADLYAHGDCAGDCEGPAPESLGVEVLDVLIVDGGVVTIAARVAPPGLAEGSQCEAPRGRHWQPPRSGPNRPPCGRGRLDVVRG